MIRAVLDANTLASGAIATGGTIGALIDTWLVGARYEAVLSTPILDELARALRKPYFVGRLSAHDRELYLAAVRRSATVVAITAPVPSVVRTRADNLVLATAASAGVPYLVTGDAELRRLGRYGNATILTPRQFVERHGFG